MVGLAASLTSLAADALSAEPLAKLSLSDRLSAAASAQMREATAQCEAGDVATCWTIGSSLMRAAKSSAPGATCALRDCDDRQVAYTELGCALALHACSAGVAEACASTRTECGDSAGALLLTQLRPDPEQGAERRQTVIAMEQTPAPVAQPVAAPAAAAVPPAPPVAGSEGMAVVVGWSDNKDELDTLDDALAAAVRSQGFKVLPRELRQAPALFLQQERRDCDPWYLRELVLHLDADLAVCASVRGEQLNLTAASLRRDTTTYATLSGRTASSTVSEQLAAISLPAIVRPGASVSLVADGKAIYDERPTVALEIPVSTRVSLGLRAGYWDAGPASSPYLLLGAQARLYFNDYQDGFFLGAQLDVETTSQTTEAIEVSNTVVAPALAAGYRVDLPLLLVVTPKLEGVVRNERVVTDTLGLAGQTSSWSDPVFDMRATVEVGIKF